MWVEEVEEEQVMEKMEAQAWLCLYNILSTKEVMEKYPLTDFRVGVLTRLQSLLTPSTLSALPLLASMQRWLVELGLSPPPSATPTLVLELVAGLRESLLEEFGGAWDTLAASQGDRFLSAESPLVKAQAERWVVAVNLWWCKV